MSVDPWAVLSDNSQRAQELRRLLDRFKLWGAPVDVTLWMDFNTAFEPYESYEQIFKGRSSRWWRAWASSAECSLIKQCMAEVIRLCPAAVKNAAGEQAIHAASAYFQCVMLVKQAGGTLTNQIMPWLMEWCSVQGRWTQLIEATLAIANIPRANAASGMAYMAVLVASDIIYLSAILASDQSTLSIKTLVEVIGVALRVSVLGPGLPFVTSVDNS